VVTEELGLVRLLLDLALHALAAAVEKLAKTYLREELAAAVMVAKETLEIRLLQALLLESLTPVRVAVVVEVRAVLG
jgi:hypothetical protein